MDNIFKELKYLNHDESFPTLITTNLDQLCSSAVKSELKRNDTQVGLNEIKPIYKPDNLRNAELRSKQ